MNLYNISVLVIISQIYSWLFLGSLGMIFTSLIDGVNIEPMLYLITFVLFIFQPVIDDIALILYE